MKNKKLALLLCLMLVVCVCAICACDFLAIPKFGHTHEYVEHQEIPATCSQKGCEKYYSCQGCDKLFDADKHEITAIPEIEMLAHELEYKLSSDGSKHYQQCKNCTYATNEVAHDYAWIQGEGVATLTCQCGKEALTCKTVLAETDRLFVDAWGESFDIDLSKFAEGLSAKKVLLGQTEGVLAQQQNVATVTTSSLFNEQNANGNCELSLVVSYEGIDLTVTLPVKVACVVDSVAKLERLAYTAGIDHTSVGATLDGNKKVVTQTLYVLTADIDGFNSRTEEYAEYEPATTPADIAKAGFRGIFDGQGHTIKNLIVGANGIFGHIGQDAVIANVTFDNITLDGQDVCLLGKAMDCSLENVDIQNIVIDSGRTSANMGVLFGQQVFSVDFANVTFDASSYNQSLTLIARNFDGGVDGEEWDFSNFQNVTVKAIYGVNGLNFYNDAPIASASGLTVEYNPFTIAMPVADESEYYYTGNEITYKIAESSLYAVTGNKQTEIGVYTVTVSLTEPAASWEGAEEGKEKEPLTFSFEIKEMTEQIAQQLASEFAGKVTALGEIQLPRDKFVVESLLAEYEVSHANVKALLTSEKATLDGYKAQADKWTVVYSDSYNDWWEGWKGGACGSTTYGVATDAQLGNVVVANFKEGVSGGSIYDKGQISATQYEKVVFYVFNPSTVDVSIQFCAGYQDWAFMSVTATANAWTEIQLAPEAFIKATGGEAGRICMIFNSAEDLGAGWLFSNYYAYLDVELLNKTVADFNKALGELPETLTLENEQAVVALREQFDGFATYILAVLDPNTESKIISAEEQIVVLKDKAAAQAVAELIEALDKQNIDADKVVEAFNAYELLTAGQKAYISAELVTKLDECKILAAEAVKQAAINAFKAKIPESSAMEYPRDNALVTALLAEYAGLSEDIKDELTAEKATLDSYKAQADKWTALFDETALATYFGNSVAGNENAIGLNVVASSSGGYIALIANPLNSANASSYDKVVFYVYNPTDSAISGYINDWATDSYNINFSLASKAWTKIEFKDHYIRAGLVNNYFYVEAQGLAFSNLFGMVDEQSAQAVVELISALPEASAITLDDKAQVVAARNAYNALGSAGKALVTNYSVLTACEAKIKELTPSGGGIVTALSVNGKVANVDYGNVLATSASAGYFEAWGTMSKAQIEALSEYEGVHFYIYNPSEVAVNFFFQDDSAWRGHDNTSLAPKAWTKVTLSDVFNWVAGANLVYVDVAKDTAGFVGEGWMISDFFGYQMSSKFAGMTKLWDVSRNSLTKHLGDGSFPYSGSVTGDIDGEYGSYAQFDVSATGDVGLCPVGMDATGYDKVVFYVYNPTDNASQHIITWAMPAWDPNTNVVIGANGWTKIEIEVSKMMGDGTGKIGVQFQNAGVGTWKITSFYGVNN